MYLELTLRQWEMAYHEMDLPEHNKMLEEL